MAGDLLAYVFRRVRAGDLQVAKDADTAAVEQARAARSAEMTLTQLGVTIVYLSRDRLAQGTLDLPPDLAGMIGQATAKGDKDFMRDVLSIIGDGGLLTKPPFNINPNRFMK
jgi:hypothetical protein